MGVARILVAGVVFIEGARAFKHKKCILERKVFAAIGVLEGVRCVGVVKVCGPVLEMRQ